MLPGDCPKTSQLLTRTGKKNSYSVCKVCEEDLQEMVFFHILSVTAEADLW